MDFSLIHTLTQTAFFHCRTSTKHTLLNCYLSQGTASSHAVSEALRVICKIFRSFIPEAIIALVSCLKIVLLKGKIKIKNCIK